MRPDEAGSGGFYWRELGQGVVVRLDGVYARGVLDRDDDPISEEDRLTGRVVVELPDYVAHSLGHALGHLQAIADRLSVSGDPEYDGPDLELAEALYAASSRAGYHCRRDWLHDRHGARLVAG